MRKGSFALMRVKAVIKVNDLAQLHDLLPLSCCWHSAALTA
jgi:hypothetical protein